MTTTLESIKSEILEQMPLLIEQDPAFCATLARALRGEFLPRIEAESRFDKLLDELRQDREEQHRKWDEQSRKWDENQLELKRLHEEVMAVSTKIDRTIGGLGARWGMQSERTFRNALAGILEKNFGVQVLNVTEYDASGEVFGRPDQVELDVIITNGLLIADKKPARQGKFLPPAAVFPSWPRRTCAPDGRAISSSCPGTSRPRSWTNRPTQGNGERGSLPQCRSCSSRGK